MTRDAGILAYGNFMIASPSETKEEIKRTVEFAKELRLDFAIFSLTRLLPGTDFYKNALRDGQVEDFWKKYAVDPTYNIPPSYCPGRFTLEELKDIAYEAYRTFYLRPGYILNYFVRILSFRLLGIAE